MSGRDTPVVTGAGAGGGSCRSERRDSGVTRACDRGRDASRDTCAGGRDTHLRVHLRNKIIMRGGRFPRAAVRTWARGRTRATALAVALLLAVTACKGEHRCRHVVDWWCEHDNGSLVDDSYCRQGDHGFQWKGDLSCVPNLQAGRVPLDLPRAGEFR